MIAEQVTTILTNIERAALKAGRKPSDIRIVAAAKKQSAVKVNEAIRAGIAIIGHNYLQEAANEIPQYLSNSSIQFHMIGHLQSNKAAKAISLFDVLETLDNLHTAEILNRKALESNKLMRVFVQINSAGEKQKSGISANESKKLIEALLSMPGLSFQGLMTMPPFFDEPEKARPYFAQLRALREEITKEFGIDGPLELSMGMSGDYEAAVEEGATLVRIGTALFGSR